ncbi:MAG: CAAD domain-containing protein [Cyanobium sp.]
MDTLSLERASDLGAPVEAALEATPFPQEPVRGSPLKLETLRSTLETLAALRPQSLEQLLPALGILGLAVVAGVGLKLTAAVLGSIDELPLLGRLLQLVGLVTAMRFLSRNALRQQQRAALLARIQKLRLDVLG